MLYVLLIYFDHFSVTIFFFLLISLLSEVCLMLVQYQLETKIVKYKVFCTFCQDEILFYIIWMHNVIYQSHFCFRNLVFIYFDCGSVF